MSSPNAGQQAGGERPTERQMSEQRQAPEQRQASEPRHAAEPQQAGEQQQVVGERREWAMSRARSDARGAGWLAFGGWVLVLAGAFNIIAGLTALFRADYFVVGGGELLLFDFGVWGYIWLAFGLLQLLAGAGCLAGQRWARMTGIGLAGLSAIGHLAFLAAFPLWELASIALAVLVMYALVVPDKDAVA
ncbi:hypothetical protein [Saccharopolyspora sp. NPDC049357]|uniref:DUF7144 family membrane protein n=1 Tax=Saccharopolyspora sp. NPDC049357 TaxID=3154507 RepID=UPI00342C4D4B